MIHISVVPPKPLHILEPHPCQHPTRNSTADMSLIAVSCEMPIYKEQFCLVYIRNTCSIWYFIQFVGIVIFTYSMYSG